MVCSAGILHLFGRHLWFRIHVCATFSCQYAISTQLTINIYSALLHRKSSFFEFCALQIQWHTKWGSCKIGIIKLKVFRNVKNDWLKIYCTIYIIPPAATAELILRPKLDLTRTHQLTQKHISFKLFGCFKHVQNSAILLNWIFQSTIFNWVLHNKRIIMNIIINEN